MSFFPKARVLGQLLPPPASGPARGALVIVGAYPHGPRPGDPSNIFFLDQLDVVAQALRDRVVDDYQQRGYTHTVAGPAVAKGYHNWYPDTNFVGRPEALAAHLALLKRRGLSVTYVALPDCAPYYDDRARAFDWAAIERDLTPLYVHPAVQASIDRVMNQWEQWQSIAVMREVWKYLRRVFPGKRLYYHNAPGHACPGESNEDEQACCREAAKFIHGHLFQSHPPSETHLPIAPRLEHVRGLWDQQRRYRGACPVPPMLAGMGLDPRSPWGAPILNVDGEPFELWDFEHSAYAITHHKEPEMTARQWGADALTVEGVVNLCDGAPLP